jgi:pyruvate carboxylase
VGDLALQLVGTGVSSDDFASDPGKYDLPDSVIGFLRGELGDPPGGWPEPFRTAALAGRRPASPPAPLTDEDLRDLAERPRAALNRLLFQGPARDFAEHRVTYGDVSLLPTREFLYGLQEGVEYAVDLEPGVRLLLGIQAVSDPDDRGMRTVIGTLNGQLRPVTVRDRSVEATEKTAEKADRSIPGHVPAPFVGTVTLQVTEGSPVTAGQVIATIEAMKMEAAITAPLDGTVARLAINPVQPVEGGDLLLVIS